MVHGPTPAAVTKQWAAQQGLLDSFSHKICVPCHSFSHFSTLLFTTLVPLFLYLSLLTINPSLNAFFLIVPILLYLYPNLTILMPLHRSSWTSIAAWLTCFPGHCWTCKILFCKRSPALPGTSLRLSVTLAYFSHSHLWNPAFPHSAIPNFWQDFMSLTVNMQHLAHHTMQFSSSCSGSLISGQGLATDLQSSKSTLLTEK